MRAAPRVVGCVGIGIGADSRAKSHVFVSGQVVGTGHRREAGASMVGLRRFGASVAVIFLLAGPPAHGQSAPSARVQDAGLRIVVLSGNDNINIISQGTAVPALVEVRDRNDLPVSGASVLFLLGEGGTATLNAGLLQVSLTTNALGQAAVTVNPLASGAVELSVSAAFGGETATAAIVQTNFATAAEAAAAGAGAAGGAGAGGGTGVGAGGAGAGAGAAGGVAAGGAAAGGLGTGAIVGIAGAAAGAAVGIGAATGGGGAPSPEPEPGSVPSAPVPPTLTAGDGELSASWTPPSDNGAAIDDYDVRYRPAAGAWTELPDAVKSAATSATLTGLTNGTTYEVQVRAGNSVGDGPWSASATGTPVSIDRVALVEFYRVTGGPGWVNDTNWDGSAPIDEWHGVTTDADGRVTRLELDNNQLSGPIPSVLGDLTNLEVLNLNRNQLSGSIPLSVGSLMRLRVLRLGSNQLSGSILSSLGRLTNLEFLNLGNNQFSGSIPPTFQQLSNLTNLYLNHNHLSGSIPALLGNLSDLVQLSLSANQFSGSIPPGLGSLASLTYLGLYENQLSGSIPSTLGNLTNLNRLHLHSNGLTGSIPSELGNLTDVTEMVLHSNNLTGSIPAALCRFERTINPQRDNVNLPGCGTPQSSVDRAALVELYNATGGDGWVNNTNWDSSAPIDEWYGVTTDADGRVTHLELAGNQLSGLIPSSLGSLTNLESLDLGDSQLSGPIPPSLGNLGNLTYLGLYGNQLSGPIPPSLGGLANLTYLALGDNRLSGPIPPSLAVLRI